MRVAFDECMPRQLKRLLPNDWEVRPLRELGLRGSVDPVLLDRLEGLVEVFVTVDTSLRFQNRFGGRSFEVVSLELKSVTTDGLALHLPLILAALRRAEPGRVLVVSPGGIEG